MIKEDVEEVALECETSNVAAQRLYHSLGFIRDKMLKRYYFSGTDAFRLKLRVKQTPLPQGDRLTLESVQEGDEGEEDDDKQEVAEADASKPK